MTSVNILQEPRGAKINTNLTHHKLKSINTNLTHHKLKFKVSVAKNNEFTLILSDDCC